MITLMGKLEQDLCYRILWNMSLQSNSPSKRRLPWVVRKVGGHYRHNFCGTEVTATAVADGILVCCEQYIALFNEFA